MIAVSSALSIPLPDESVHCVVTSPPYWGLRCYGVDGQLGLEDTPEEYVARMVEVFREVRRVMRPDATCWLNLGDSFAGARGGTQGETGQRARRTQPPGRERSETREASGLKPGDLVGIPWRVAFALQADGWWLRQDNVWHKPNPMPESLNGWRWEKCRVKVGARAGNKQTTNVGSHTAQSGGVETAEWSPCPGCDKCAPNDGLVLRKGSWRTTSAHEYVFQLAKAPQYFCDAEAVREPVSQTDGAKAWRRIFDPAKDRKQIALGRTPGKRNKQDGAGRNPRSVWSITTRPYSGAHFATFPPELPERCIRAATPEKVCGDCGAPWAPVVEISGGTTGRSWHEGDDRLARGQRSGTRENRRLAADGFETDYQRKVLAHRPTCDHGAEPARAVVLDPFGGAGTTKLQAEAMGRRAVSLDLSLAYSRMAALRTDHRAERPLRMAAIEGPLFQ